MYILMTLNDIKDFIEVVEEADKLDGDFAELGVYLGGTAMLMCEARKNGKAVHLFESEEGLQKLDIIDTANFTRGELRTNKDFVNAFLINQKNVFFHWGWFPETSSPVEDKKFAFVHIDANLYQSTKDALEFFYPRMVDNGYILLHDYSQIVGVKVAVNEFCIRNNIESTKLRNLYALIRKKDNGVKLIF